MKLIQKIKAVNWGYLWLAILIGCAGVLLLLYPNKTMDVVSITVGAVAVLFGAVQLIRFLVSKKRGVEFTFGIICGIITIVAGALCIFLREQTKDLICALVALFLVIDASFKLQTVVRARRLKSKACWFLFTFSVISIVLSFLIMYLDSLETSIVLFFLGAALVADAIGNLISLFYVGWIDREETEAAIRTRFEIQSAEESNDRKDKKKKKKLKKGQETEAVTEAETATPALSEEAATIEIPAEPTEEQPAEVEAQTEAAPESEQTEGNAQTDNQ